MPTIMVQLKEGKTLKKYGLKISDKPQRVTVDKQTYDAMTKDGVLTVSVVADDPAPKPQPKPAVAPALTAAAAKPNPAKPAVKPSAKPAGNNPAAPKAKPAESDTGEE